MCLDYNLLMRALDDQEVKYLVVGGRAVKHYCPEREVDDLDLMINPTEENAVKVELALTHLIKEGFNFIGMGIDMGKNLNRINKLAKPGKLFSLKSECIPWATKTINADILTSPIGFDFNSAFENSIVEEINGIQALIMSCCDLIRHKNTAREKDRDDVKLLKLKCRDCDWLISTSII